MICLRSYIIYVWFPWHGIKLYLSILLPLSIQVCGLLKCNCIWLVYEIWWCWENYIFEDEIASPKYVPNQLKSQGLVEGLYSRFDHEWVDREYSIEPSFRLTDDGKSFMKTKNRRGPRTDPWGTPLTTGIGLDTSPSSTTYCTLLLRKAETHLQMLPRIP